MNNNKNVYNPEHIDAYLSNIIGTSVIVSIIIDKYILLNVAGNLKQTRNLDKNLVTYTVENNNGISICFTPDVVVKHELVNSRILITIKSKSNDKPLSDSFR
jgi:hypothetical protein